MALKELFSHELVMEAMEDKFSKRKKEGNSSSLRVEESSRNVYTISDEGGRKKKVFVKSGTGGRASLSGEELLYEMSGLQSLRKAVGSHQQDGWSLVVPEPYGVTKDHKGDWVLVMDFLNYSPKQSSSGDDGAKLGKGLAKVHLFERMKRERGGESVKGFGYEREGVLGAEKQPNNFHSNWVEFWREERLSYQLKRIEQQYGDKELREKGERLKKGLPLLFRGMRVEEIEPCLLHGDLWAGNVAQVIENTERGKRENVAIFDPAVYYGHNEADFGIAKMFGGGCFSPSFYSSYHQLIKEKEGERERAWLYELHHHLNHYNIFGFGYRSGAVSLVDRLLSYFSQFRE